MLWLSFCMYSLCSGGGAQPIEPKSSGRTFEKLCGIRNYAHPDFLAEVQCNLGGRTIERVRYLFSSDYIRSEWNSK